MIAYETDAPPPADLERVLACLLGASSHARDIACAVKTFLADDPGRSVAASDGALMHAARALAAVGEAESAHAVWSATGPGSAWLAQVDPAALPAETLRLMECGLLRAATSPVLGAGVLAALDLRAVPVEAPPLELIYLPLAHRLVDACAPLWRISSGRGALVVQGLRLHAGGRTGRAGRRGDPEAWLRRAFQQQLERWAGREGWAGAPRLVQAS